MMSRHRTITTLAVLGVGLAALSIALKPPGVHESTSPSQSPRLERVGTGDPVIQADAVLVIHIQDGTILYEHNAHETLPIASLTKLMTA